MSLPLFLLVPLIAFLYASVGFGGATGYLAAMSFFGLPPHTMASTALILNILVAGISLSSFYRAGHLRLDLGLPFLITSVPAAFIGGSYKITDIVYYNLLYSVLTFVAINLLFFSKQSDIHKPMRSVHPVLASVIGSGIGLLSGMVGIGGGIFLSPIILYARWGTSKQASAVAAAFIVLNSMSGLLGRISSGNFHIDTFTVWLIPFGMVGALLGSYLGARRLSNLNLRRILGGVMTLVVSNYWLSLWH